MSEPTRSVNFVNIASGVCFVAFGVLLLMERAGTIEMRQLIDLWPVVLVVVGAAVVLQASRGGDMRGSGACAGWLFWVVVLGLLSSHAYDRRTQEALSIFAVMSGDRRPAPEGTFNGATMTTLLGGTHLDLTRATLAPGETAVIDLFTALGGTEIIAPSHWRVDIQTTTVAGGVTDQRRPRAQAVNPDAVSAEAGGGAHPDAAPALPPATPPRLVLQGIVVMGGVSIK